MPSTTSLAASLAASLLLANTATAHMIMAKPVPYGKPDNSPITGSNYPCKTNNGFTVVTENKMSVGSKQQLSFSGSAVHGGGSCQLAVTLDRTPTPQSKFKVIKSIEGGCPGVNGPETFDFELPKEIPNGQATFAWTWFAKLSGAPEMYMNCAPITVDGGASDSSGFDKLPDMFVANIAPVSQCTTPVSGDTKFPNPGTNLQTLASSATAPQGASCGAAVGGGSGGSGSSPSPSGGAGSGSGSGSGASSVVPVPPAGGATSKSAPTPTNGGVFAPGASSPAGGAGPSALPTSTLTTLLTVTGAPGGGSGSAPTSAAAPVASQPAGTGGNAPTPTGGSGSGTGGSGSGNGTSCSPDGSVVCNGATQFGLCNFGKVATWQPVAAGTTCSGNAIQKMKRAPIVPHAHHRRAVVHYGSH